MPNRMVVAVSGTPGSGKSAFARLLAGRLNAKLIDLNEMILGKGFYELDAKGTRVAKLRPMRAEFGRVVRNSPQNLVVEGLLAHLLPTKSLTHVIILRTRPKVLEKRLRARGYSGRKLKDNLESEALSIILWEAVQAHGVDKVYEIDTTGLKTIAGVKLFLNALAGEISLKPGKVDWLEDYYRNKFLDGGWIEILVMDLF